MAGYTDEHLAIIAKMVRVPVVGSHHKQRQTIKGWVGGFDGDVLDDAIDDLIADPKAPLREKGRGTITLTSVHDAKEFIKRHDDNDNFTWYI